MTKPAPSKKDVRREIDSMVEEFIKANGKIQRVEMGESGLIDGKYNTNHIGFSEPRKERTSLNHVVDAIEKRKASKSSPSRSTSKRPKKKIIYDDFGDPIRWVWEE